MKLQNANVVVTGGSQGIGREIARVAAAKGANVLLVARSEDLLKELANEIGGEYIVADLTNESDLDGLVDAAVERMGHVDVWVNNAGLETSGTFTTTDRDIVRSVVRLNLEATTLLTHDILGHMLPRGGGHIVQMSSVAGAISFPGLAAYCGTKAGLTNLTETLRLELAGSGIGLTVVAPGPVDTEMWDRLEEANQKYVNSSLKRFRLVQFLPKVTPEKLAAAVVKAVEGGKPHVRLARRFAPFHMLNNLPRRLVAITLTGIKPKAQDR